MLMFNRKLTAQEAFERNLVTEVVPDAQFQKRVLERLTEISKLPKEVFYNFYNLFQIGLFNINLFILVFT